jgi:hypothetical protein
LCDGETDGDLWEEASGEVWGLEALIDEGIDAKGGESEVWDGDEAIDAGDVEFSVVGHEEFD